VTYLHAEGNTGDSHEVKLQATAFNDDAVRRLIADVVADPKLRAEIYKEPSLVAANYGLNASQGEALTTLKASLASAFGQTQLEVLNESLVSMLYGPTPGPGTPDGGAPDRRCRPSGCAPGCNPDATCRPGQQN
jgi:hypothetical protein